MTLCRLALIATLAACVVTTGAHAQAAVAPGAQPEVRVDALFGNRAAVQGGAGVQFPAGLYVRIGAGLLAGVRTGQVDGSRLDGRVDLLGRFLLDPYHQSRFGFSAGAGLTTRFERGERTVPLLLVALDLEEHQRGDVWVRALQVGLGGGARIGLVFRRAEDAAR